jgi:hypothetical protein
MMSMTARRATSGVIKHGTARQEAEHEQGYSANGESRYSRNAAQVNIRLGEGRRTNGRLIREQSGALAKLKFKASIESDPVRLAKLRKDIGIKTKFIAKISAQYREEHPDDPMVVGPKVGEQSAEWNWQTVDTIEGEDSFEPWDKR